MVDMVYHQRNKSEDGDGLDDGPEWIVEPNQDGDLYVATRAPNIGIHKLNLTVRQLAEELSPYASDDPPVVYTAEKRNTLYTVDAATGRILKQFSSSGSSVIDEGSCRRISGFEGIDEDECESIGTLALGRTEYTVGIANRDTGTPICTIRYFEWAPNNRDRDLQDQYSSTMDNKYVYSKHDGYVYALDHTKERERHVYRGKFDSPVVRVFQMGGEEITVPGEDAPTVDGTEGMVQPGEAPGRTDSPQPGDEGENGQETPKKKKAHRGQRGGRKRNKNRRNTNAESEGEETEKVVANVKKFGEDQNVSADEEAVSGQGVSEFSSAKQIHNLTITDKVLGSGSGGTFVFEGKFEGRDVAVKRMLPQYYELADQEVSLLTQSDDHPNVIRYFCKQKDENFLYIAVELCQASLWDLYKDGRNDDPWTDQQVGLVNEINTDVPRALYQLAAGLHHLHSLRIIHRDIKPQNILIAYPKKNQTGGPRFVISDFGLCKTLPDNVSTLVGTTNNAGTIGWKAPELILKPKDQGVKRSVDIFSLGCVFFYVLTNGSHPFDDEEGWMQIRELNIKKNKFNFSKLEYLGDDSEEPIHLISRMLSNNPVDRPTAMQVMQHPFFWSPEKRLTFLCQVSDRFEFEPRDPPSTSLCRLEARNIEVMCPAPKGQHTNHTFSKFPDFLSKLDRKFIDTLGKQRKYNGDKMLDLLRALRNKKNHYYDMPSDVQAKVGPLPDGYLRYWTTRFPKLLMACYEVVVECGFDQEPGFRTYFEPATP
ncbi:putative protein kinase and ribonuclease protein [Neofusicoccum parvum UCRNP2]|uniref:non-specific serine/threonine protein kinase n=1 Tax=Botryosphaeria parva (strain UCR-NP2) TaxID=1287680 RepID=R1GBA1_BOTPV|nr:putative protein kinase and ribonuclease protein [Neofusicoccum parvum UCRNP2]